MKAPCDLLSQGTLAGLVTELVGHIRARSFDRTRTSVTVITEESSGDWPPSPGRWASCQAHRIVDTEESGGPIRQMTDNQAIWLATVFMQNYEVCKIMRTAALHQLRHHLQRITSLGCADNRQALPHASTDVHVSLVIRQCWQRPVVCTAIAPAEIVPAGCKGRIDQQQSTWILF